MKRIFITSLFLILAIADSFSQDFKSLVFNSEDFPYEMYASYGFNILELSDGNIVFTQSYTYDADCNNPIDIAVNLVKISRNAEIIDTKLYEFKHEGSTDYCNSLLIKNPMAGNSNIYIYYSYGDTCYYHAVFFDNELNITDEIKKPLLDNFRGAHYSMLDTENNLVYLWYDEVIKKQRLARYDIYGNLMDSISTEFKAGLKRATYPLFIYNEEPLEYGILNRYEKGDHIIILDRDFNYIGYKEFSGYDNYKINIIDYIPNMVRLDDGSLAMIEHFDRNTYYPGSPDNAYLELCKFDKDLNIIEKSRIRSEYWLQGEENYCLLTNTFKSLVKCDDGSLYCIWWLDDGSYSYLNVTRFNNNMELQWERTSIEDPGSFEPPVYASIAIENNGLAFISDLYEERPAPSHTFAAIFEHDGTISTSEQFSGFRPYSFYPNPANDKINIRFSPDAKCEKVEIYGIDGKLYHTQNFSLNSINIDELSNGIYMMKVTLENGNVFTEKIAVK